mmetsp:Transcript_1365/g.3058  ORF Transcript_1365/g.3058 Transcript_1365/m.3058 type:complete len:252 (+) Transcript_1365:542-1297(+)
MSQFHQRRCRRRDQRGAAVHDGRAAAAADGARIGLGHRDVCQIGGPVVFPKDPGRGHGPGIPGNTIGPPGEITMASRLLVEANGELVHVVVHQQGLLHGVVAELGANAHNGGELGGVQDGNLMLHNLPNGLMSGYKVWANLHSVEAQHGGAGPAAVDVLRHGAVLLVGLAELMVVGRGGVHAVLTSGATNHDLEGASVKDCCNTLTTDLEIGKVLDVLMIVQDLPEGLRPRGFSETIGPARQRQGDQDQLH